MPRVIWSQSALLDVQSLHRFLMPISADAAQRAVAALRRGVKVLGQQPGIGRPIEDMDDAFREWLIDFGGSGYVIRYHIDAEIVTILALRHQREVGF